MRIRQTYGKYINKTGEDLPKITDNEYYRMQSIDFSKKYGVYTLTPQSLLRFTERLERGGFDQLIIYLADKAGFDSNWDIHKQLVIKIYTEDGLIGDEYTNVRLICIMSEGLTNDEVQHCWDRKLKDRQKVIGYENISTFLSS